jgi:hypothetical protein
VCIYVQYAINPLATFDEQCSAEVEKNPHGFNRSKSGQIFILFLQSTCLYLLLTKAISITEGRAEKESEGRIHIQWPRAYAL